MGGRMIFQVERVEVGVELAPDTFTLQPSAESGRVGSGKVKRLGHAASHLARERGGLGFA